MDAPKRRAPRDVIVPDVWADFYKRLTSRRPCVSGHVAVTEHTERRRRESSRPTRDPDPTSVSQYRIDPDQAGADWSMWSKSSLSRRPGRPGRRRSQSGGQGLDGPLSGFGTGSVTTELFESDAQIEISCTAVLPRGVMPSDRSGRRRSGWDCGRPIGDGRGVDGDTDTFRRPRRGSPVPGLGLGTASWVGNRILRPGAGPPGSGSPTPRRKAPQAAFGGMGPSAPSPVSVVRPGAASSRASRREIRPGAVGR